MPGTSPGRVALYLTALFFALFAFIPFAWMILTMFKTDNDLYNPRNNPLALQRPADVRQHQPAVERHQLPHIHRSTRC